MAESATGRALAFTLTILRQGQEFGCVALHAGARMRIGRDPRMEVHLDDSSVSRMHAEVRERGGEVRLRDLRSLNGTHLNGESVTETVVRIGDVVRIGIFTLLLGRADALLPDDNEPISNHPAWRRQDLFEIIHALDLEEMDPRSSRLSTNLTSMGLDPEEARRSQRKLSSAYSKLLSLMNAVARIGRLTDREQIVRQFLEALLSSFDNVECVALFGTPERDRAPVLHRDSQTGRMTIHDDDTTQGLIARALESHSAIYAVDGNPSTHHDSSTHRTRRSMMCSPFIVRGESRGLLYVENSRKPYCFDHFDLDLLAVFAFHLGAALENSQLILDITERKRAEEEMRFQEEVLRHASAQTLQAQERERMRISRELHDGVGQSLTALRYQLESVRTLARPMPNNEALMRELKEIGNFVATVIDDLRTISLDLRPTMLDDLGLEPTVEWFARQFDERRGIHVEREYVLGEEAIPSATATAAFRIIQEALGNIYKHARATRAWVHLEREGDTLKLTVRDNGEGFDPASLRSRAPQQAGSGIVNMRERALSLGGHFTLDATPGRGTTISVRLPLTEG